MYNDRAIKWIKSVTRDGGNAWAYLEYNVGDIFDLRFPDNALWVCEFDFETRFPVLGDGLIECHRRLPIATGEMRKTTMKGLALVNWE
jgi:hypothetical protein